MRAWARRLREANVGARLLSAVLVISGVATLVDGASAIFDGEQLIGTISRRGAIWLAVCALTGVALLLAFRPRTERTLRQEDIVPGLLASGQEFCLLLRPFGYEGRLLLPDLGGGEATARRSKPVEQVVAEVARRVDHLPTYALADPSTRRAPAGPTFLRTRDSDWPDVVRRLIERAHTVVLLHPPDQPVGTGFAWELRVIAGRQRQPRVVVVLPPPGTVEHEPCSAWHRACLTVAALRQEYDTPAELSQQAREYADRLDQATVVLKIHEHTDPAAWLAVGKRREAHPVAAALAPTEHVIYPVSVYAESLAVAFQRVNQQLADLPAPEPYVRAGAAEMPPPALLPECPICGASA